MNRVQNMYLATQSNLPGSEIQEIPNTVSVSGSIEYDNADLAAGKNQVTRTAAPPRHHHSHKRQSNREYTSAFLDNDISMRSKDHEFGPSEPKLIKTEIVTRQHYIGHIHIVAKSQSAASLFVWMTIFLYLTWLGYGIAGLVGLFSHEPFNTQTLLIMTIILASILAFLGGISTIVYSQTHSMLSDSQTMTTRRPWLMGMLLFIVSLTGLFTLNGDDPDVNDIIPRGIYENILTLYVVGTIILLEPVVRAIYAHRNPIIETPYSLNLSLSNTELQ